VRLQIVNRKRQQRTAGAVGVVDDLDHSGLAETPFGQAVHWKVVGAASQ
jgi:hypothetical protein